MVICLKHDIKHVQNVLHGNKHVVIKTCFKQNLKNKKHVFWQPCTRLRRQPVLWPGIVMFRWWRLNITEHVYFGASRQMLFTTFKTLLYCFFKRLYVSTAERHRYYMHVLNETKMYVIKYYSSTVTRIEMRRYTSRRRNIIYHSYVR